MTFIVYEQDGSKHTFNSNRKREDDAWDEVYDKFPNAKYIKIL